MSSYLSFVLLLAASGCFVCSTHADDHSGRAGDAADGSGGAPARVVAVVPTIPIGDDSAWPLDASLRALDLEHDALGAGSLSPLAAVVRAAVASGAFTSVVVAPLSSPEGSGSPHEAMYLRSLVSSAVLSEGAQLHVPSDGVRRAAVERAAAASGGSSADAAAAWMAHVEAVVDTDDGAGASHGPLPVLVSPPLVNGMSAAATMLLAQDVLAANPSADAVVVLNPASALMEATELATAVSTLVPSTDNGEEVSQRSCCVSGPPTNSPGHAGRDGASHAALRRCRHGAGVAAGSHRWRGVSSQLRSRRQVAARCSSNAPNLYGPLCVRRVAYQCAGSGFHHD